MHSAHEPLQLSMERNIPDRKITTMETDNYINYSEIKEINS